MSIQASEEQRLAEAAVLADKLAQQHADFSTTIEQITRARDAFERRMNDAVAAAELAHQDRAADAAAAASMLPSAKAPFSHDLAPPLLPRSDSNAASLTQRLPSGARSSA